MGQYLILLRDEHMVAPVSPRPQAVREQLLQDMMAWTASIAAEERLVAVQRLTKDGRVLRGREAPITIDGPYSETKEAIGGFVLIEAPSWHEAERIAAACPGLAQGFALEVRAVVAEE